MSGLPDMYTPSPRAEVVHIRQTTNAHGITVKCLTAPPPGELEAAQARKHVSLQAHCIYREGCWWVFINKKLSVHCICSKGCTL